MYADIVKTEKLEGDGGGTREIMVLGDDFDGNILDPRRGIYGD